MTEDKPFLVYEAVNEGLKQIHVAATERSMHETIEAYRHALPEPIKHWDPGDIDALRFRSIEFDLSAEEAAEFVQRHAKDRKLAEGWKIIAQPGLDYPEG